jgi:hypothetical protein
LYQQHFQAYHQHVHWKTACCTFIDELDIDVKAPLKDILDATLAVTESTSALRRESLSGHGGRQFPTGRHRPGHTLKKVNEARVWQLIYSGDFHCPGFECGSVRRSTRSIDRRACIAAGRSLRERRCGESD